MFEVLWGKKFNQSSIQNAQVTSAVGEEGRLTFRNAVAVLAVLFCLHSHNSFAVTDDTIPFNIPQQRADTALTQFAEQANLTLVFPFEQLKDKTANRLVGDYPIATAINLLLRNTGLTPRFSDQLVLTIASEPKGKRMNTTNSSKRKTVLAGLVGLFAAGGMTQAVAQGGEAATGQSAIDEIIVTANKREQRLIDVPISVAVVTGEYIQNSGIENIADLSYVVPNLSVVERGMGDQQILMRGVGNLTGSSALVGIYLDEIPVSSAAPNSQLNLQAFDLKRVEVLRGPQGTLYGQGSMGGTIRFLTNDPVFNEIGGNIDFALSNTENGGWNEEVKGVINMPVIDDVMAFRLAATYSDQDGWIDQPATGRENINDSELSNIRLKGLWEPADNLSISLLTIRHRSNGGYNNEIVTFLPIEDSQYQSAVDASLSDNKIVDDYDLYNITIEYDLGFAELTSATSYFENEKLRRENSIFALPIEIMLNDFQQKNETFAQEIRLSDESENSSLSWTLGLFYSDTDRLDRTSSADFGIGGTFLFSAVLDDELRKSESIAYFGDVAYAITDRVTAGIGTRYFEDDREFSSGGVMLAETFDRLSSKVYLSFSAANNINLYVSVAEGFRSGGFNAITTSVPSYEPEVLISYEAGLKAHFYDNQIQTEVALYYSDYKDFQSQNVNTMGQGFTDNPGEARIQGVEWNINWSVSENFAVAISGNLTDGEFTKIDSAQPTKFVGDPLDWVPEYSYSINADYGFNWTQDARGYIRLAYNVQGGNSTANRTPGLPQAVFETDSISLLDTRIGVEWGSITAEIYGNNLLDEDEITAATPIYLAPQERPRSAGLRVKYDF